MSGPDRRGRGNRTRPEDITTRRAPSLQAISPITPSSQSFSPYSRLGPAHPLHGSPFQGSPINTGGQPDPYRESLRVATEAPPGKVAIPPLKTSHAGETSPKDRKKGRTTHACETCRKAKAGCTGGQPCLRCRNTQVPCVYGDGKRDKERKIMTQLNRETKSLNQHNSSVTEALRQIVLDNSLSREGLRAAIDAVLAMSPARTPPGKRFEHRPSDSRDSSEHEGRENSGEYDADADVGSVGSLDVVNVDTDKENNRGTGHVGKMSAVAWAKRTTEECRQSSRQNSPQREFGPDLTSLSYFTEDADLDFVDTSNVNMFDWPEETLADMLLHTYFEQVHNAFPILDMEDFMSRYKQFDRDSSDFSSDDRFWLAQLNAVFAIAAVFLHITKSRTRSHHHDHLIYCARARLLCMSEEILYEDAQVATTCALGLLCLYYFATCRLNKAFTICGLAMRNAVALGLHARNQVDQLTDADKEYRVRMWWSLYSLECSLDQFTGRPTCVSDRDISTPLPINVDEHEFLRRKHLNEKQNDGHKPEAATYQRSSGSTGPQTAFPALKLPITSSSYFILRTELSIILHEIITDLYCAAVSREKWNEVESIIRRIDERLLRWRDRLPQEFDITLDPLSKPDWSDPYILQRTGLAMMFNSAQMTLFRPCLCQFEGRIRRQSDKSKNFNQEAAETCIGAARSMVNMLSWNTADAAKVYAVMPWWNTLHNLCEALSVLTLEIAFQSSHLPDQAGSILTDAKRGIRWLIMMSEQSISARKAWEVYDSLVRLVAPRIKHSVEDMPFEAPIPPGYNWRRFHSDQLILPQPQQPLPEPNFPQFQSSASLVSMPHPVTTAPIVWSDPQPHFPYTTAEYPAYAQLAANPLDNAAALQRFSRIGHLHGHFDDPWQHMFDVSTAVQEIGMVAPDLMDIQMGPSLEMMVGSAIGIGVGQTAYYPPAGYPVHGSQYQQTNGYTGPPYSAPGETPGERG